MCPKTCSTDSGATSHQPSSSSLRRRSRRRTFVPALTARLTSGRLAFRRAPFARFRSLELSSRPTCRCGRRGAQLQDRDRACASFNKARKGSIEVGKLADLVMLHEDVARVPPENLAQVPVVMTIVDGKVMHEAST